MLRTWVSRICRGLFQTEDEGNIEFLDKFREESQEKTVPGPPIGEVAATFVGAHPPPISEEQFLKEFADDWGTWEDLLRKDSTKVETSNGVLDLPPGE